MVSRYEHVIGCSFLKRDFKHISSAAQADICVTCQNGIVAVLMLKTWYVHTVRWSCPLKNS